MTATEISDTQVVRITGCDIDLTVPYRAWRNHLADAHATRHRKGHDGLSACCPGLMVTPVRMSDEKQALGIRVLCGDLGRACPELKHLTWDEAGDLIVRLRAELLEQQRKAG